MQCFFTKNFLNRSPGTIDRPNLKLGLLLCGKPIDPQAIVFVINATIGMMLAISFAHLNGGSGQLAAAAGRTIMTVSRIGQYRVTDRRLAPVAIERTFFGKYKQLSGTGKPKVLIIHPIAIFLSKIGEIFIPAATVDLRELLDRGYYRPAVMGKEIADFHGFASGSIVFEIINLGWRWQTEI